MGSAIDQKTYTDADYKLFHDRLLDNLKALRLLLERNSFGVGKPSFGAELELYIMDKQTHPLSINTELLELLKDPYFTLELNRYNLEYNFPPVSITKDAFTQFENMAFKMLNKLDKAADSLNARVMPIGILPTLKFDDFGAQAMTDQPRYHVLADMLKRLRGEHHPFEVNIDGKEPLKFCSNEITFEGANASFQFHYRVNPDEFADAFNAAQMITPLLLAVGANSPLMLGHKLWHETRIVLFKQAVDCRNDRPAHPRDLPRVNFGNGWVRKGIDELFAESVSLYPTLIPKVTDEDVLACVASGGVPQLEELRMHQGCLWPWNRPIYDPTGDGHVRIELRALPSGPSVIDMVANAAFAVGLIEYLKPHMQDILPALPFNYAVNNFYRAAQFSMDAILIWPAHGQTTPQEIQAIELIKQMLDKAEQGLKSLGIANKDIKRLLGIISERVDKKINGAYWQLMQLDKLDKKYKREEALQLLTEYYYEKYKSGLPVSQWSLSN